MGEVRIIPEGDLALLVEFGKEISPECNSRVSQLNNQIRNSCKKGIVETIPAFCSLLIYYNPEQISYKRLCRYISRLLQKPAEESVQTGRIIEIPVLYGGSCGEDMARVCAHTGLSEQEVIQLHTATEYPIYMLGFLPGFPYLGGLDKRLETPRLEDPRTTIPAGSVGIGGEQTGIYPMASPGGWCLIGQTPLCLFDSTRENPVLYEAGDRIRFRSIDEKEYQEIKRLEEERCIAAKVRADRSQKSSEKNNERQTEANRNLKTGSFEVVFQGALTTIQDYGRTGYGDKGFSPSGAVDREAMENANILVNNPETEAVLECTLVGPSLRFNQDTIIAITGADMQAKTGDRPVPLNCAFMIHTGELLQLGMAVKGCRTYIAFAGGIQVENVLGSRSLNLKCGLGGGFGRALRAGDRIDIGETTLNTRTIVNHIFKEKTMLPENEVKILRVVMGPQESYFTDEGIHTFINNIYTVSNDSNRMACKMSGAAIESVTGSDIISDGIALGSIQVASNGCPIVMLTDRQTTGGYAKIAIMLPTL